MKNLIFIGSILLSSISYSQITLIPDINFEQKLIDLGYDTGSPDGSVLTSNINLITSLDCRSLNISSLIGIEDFTALSDLICKDNVLTDIDLTQNSNLLFLECSNNHLSSLNLSQNDSLLFLVCNNNLISNLDLT